MKPDVDIFRKILLTAQEATESELPIQSIETLDTDTFYFHTKLLKERGLIKANILESGYPLTVAGVDILGLEWQGHELLKDIADDNMWNKIKGYILKTTGALSLELIIEGVKAAVAS